MSGLSEHVIETFGITQAIVDAIGGVDADTYRAITDVFIERQHEQVVRCRDCKWFTPEQTWGEDRGLGMVEFFTDPSDCGNPERCSHHYDSLAGQTVPVHIVTDADGFCAWGERRDGE